MKYFFQHLLVLIAWYLPVTAQQTDILQGIKTRMRDSVLINVTVYKPHNQQEALPVTLLITPYISDNYHSRAVYFARNGYVFVIADSRGRGNSEGIFRPFMQEAEDGYDLVEWLAAQSWCNGKVGMWGVLQWIFPMGCRPDLPIRSL